MTARCLIKKAELSVTFGGTKKQEQTSSCVDVMREVMHGKSFSSGHLPISIIVIASALQLYSQILVLSGNI